MTGSPIGRSRFGILRSSLAVVPVIACLLAASAWTLPQPAPPQSAFARLINQLSEPGGYFDTDNLISNEKSYLHVIPDLEQNGVRGGVYIGVGPDQNFSYIARIRPSAAFIVDIRRDNLLLQLLFKALFASSRNRAEYLCLLTGRAIPANPDAWRNSSIDQIISYVDGAKPGDAAANGRHLHEIISAFGLEVTAADLSTIDKFHAAFVDEGLSLRFHSFGRPPQSYDPSYRELLIETDRKGRRLSYLASEDDFQFVRSLEARDAVIPVVGDLAGTHALAAIGQWMTEHNALLSAFYVSNVENYLFRDGNFEKYMENLNRIPHNSHSAIIRSTFGGFRMPETVPGYYSASTVQNFNDLLENFSAGKYQSYSDLVRK